MERQLFQRFETCGGFLEAAAAHVAQRRHDHTPYGRRIIDDKGSVHFWVGARSFPFCTSGREAQNGRCAKVQGKARFEESGPLFTVAWPTSTRRHLASG